MAAISTTFETILVTQEGVTARITLNRPEKRNALSVELMEELIDSLETLGASPEVRASLFQQATT